MPRESELRVIDQARERAGVEHGLFEAVALLALVDPLLAGSVSSSGIAVRVSVVSASGALRVYPNPGFGDLEVPFKPNSDPRGDWLFGLAANSLAAGRVGPVWSQPYAAAGDGTPVVAVVAPGAGADNLRSGRDDHGRAQGRGARLYPQGRAGG